MNRNIEDCFFDTCVHLFFCCRRRSQECR